MWHMTDQKGNVESPFLVCLLSQSLHVLYGTQAAENDKLPSQVVRVLGALLRELQIASAQGEVAKLPRDRQTDRHTHTHKDALVDKSVHRSKSTVTLLHMSPIFG